MTGGCGASTPYLRRKSARCRGLLSRESELLNTSPKSLQLLRVCLAAGAIAGTLALNANAQARPDVVWMAGGHSEAVTKAVCSPDGRYWLTIGGEAKLWRAADGALLRTFTDSAWTAAFSPDAKYVVTGASNSRGLQLWALPEGRLVWAKETPYSISTLAYAGDGTVLFVAQSNGRIASWAMPEGRMYATREAHDDDIWAMVTSPDGRLLATGSYDRTVRIWRTINGELVRTLADNYEAHALAFSPDSELLAAAGRKRRGMSPKLWRVSDGELIQTFEAQSDPAYDIAFSPDGQMLAAARQSGDVTLWRIPDGDLFGTLRGHSGTVHTVAFAPNGRRLISGGSDRTARFWKIPQLKAAGTLTRHTSQAYFAGSPDGRWVATGTYDGSVRLLRAQDGAMVRVIAEGRGAVRPLVFSPDSQSLAVGSANGTLELFSIPDGQLLRRFESTQVRTLDFSPDGTLLAAGTGRSEGHVWRIADGEAVHRVSSGASGVAFSPDGRSLVTSGGYSDHVIRIWSIPDGELLNSIPAYTPLSRVDFSPDGLTLAAGGFYGVLQSWRISDGSLLWENWSGALNGGGSLAYSPDGRTIVSALGGLENVSVWRAEDGVRLEYFPEETIVPNSVQYSGDGQYFGWGRIDGTVVLAGSPYQGEVACGSEARLLIRCRKQGANVVAGIKAAVPGTEVTFTLDSQGARTIVADERGNARVQYGSMERRSHTVRACGLRAECARP